MAARHDTVDRHQTAGVDEYGITDPQLVGGSLAHSAGAANRDRTGDEIHQIPDGPPAARNGHSLEHLSYKNEQCDDERGKELGDTSRSDDRNAHGQFHGHPSCARVLGRFLEDRPTADQNAQEAYQADPRQRFPYVEPHGRRRKCDQDDPRRFDPAKDMVALLSRWGGSRTLCLIGQSRSFDWFTLIHRIALSYLRYA